MASPGAGFYAQGMTVTLDTLDTLDTEAEVRGEPVPPVRVDTESTPSPATAYTRAAAPAPVSAVSRRPGPVRPHRPVLSVSAGRATAAILFAGFFVGVAIEPVPDGPNPVLPWWANAISMATLVTLLVCWGALALGRRYGLWAGVVAGVGLVVQTVLCPTVDHHTIAGWWWAQLAIGVGMLVVNAGLLAGTRPDPRG